MEGGPAAILLIVGGGVSLVAVFLAANALFPRLIEQGMRTAEAAPGRSFLVGFINVLTLGAITAVFFALSDGVSGIFAVPGVAFLSVLAVLLTFGLTGVAGLIGGRLWPEASPRRQMIWGGAVLILGGLAPFIGWFGLFPYTAMLGLGAVILSWFRRPPPPPEEA